MKHSRPSPQDSERVERRLGEVLVELKLITEKQLVEALLQQKKLQAEGKHVFKIGELLLFNESINLNQLKEALEFQKRRAEKAHSDAVAAENELKKFSLSPESIKESREVSGLWEALRKVLLGQD